MRSARRAMIHSVVVTGNEPRGGVAIVGDYGEDVVPRYLCLEVPKSEAASLGRALIAAGEEVEKERPMRTIRCVVTPYGVDMRRYTAFVNLDAIDAPSMTTVGELIEELQSRTGMAGDWEAWEPDRVQKVWVRIEDDELLDDFANSGDKDGSDPSCTIHVYDKRREADRLAYFGKRETILQ